MIWFKKVALNGYRVSRKTGPATLARASAVLILNDATTGYPLACIEASLIRATRTATSAALAAEHIFPQITGLLQAVGDKAMEAMPATCERCSPSMAIRASTAIVERSLLKYPADRSRRGAHGGI